MRLQPYKKRPIVIAMGLFLILVFAFVQPHLSFYMQAGCVGLLLLILGLSKQSLWATIFTRLKRLSILLLSIGLFGAWQWAVWQKASAGTIDWLGLLVTVSAPMLSVVALVALVTWLFSYASHQEVAAGLVLLLWPCTWFGFRPQAFAFALASVIESVPQALQDLQNLLLHLRSQAVSDGQGLVIKALAHRIRAIENEALS